MILTAALDEWPSLAFSHSPHPTAAEGHKEDQCSATHAQEGQGDGNVGKFLAFGSQRPHSFTHHVVHESKEATGKSRDASAHS